MYTVVQEHTKYTVKRVPYGTVQYGTVRYRYGEWSNYTEYDKNCQDTDTVRYRFHTVPVYYNIYYNTVR